MYYAYEILCDMGCDIPSENFFTTDESSSTINFTNNCSNIKTKYNTAMVAANSSSDESSSNESSSPPSLSVQNTLPFLTKLDPLEPDSCSTPITPRYLREFSF